MNNQRGESFSYAGIPYEDINWYDIEGQPFGVASFFNAIVFGDANNIVDTKGAFAVGRDFVSPRGLSLAYGNDLKLTGTGYSPNAVRFLVGRNISMQGPLVVIGHVVAGGNFKAAPGSTYMIGKDGSPYQVEELTSLYQAAGGSRYWTPSDRGSHYAISSYDTPRFIPARRIEADVTGFFNDARDSIENYHRCITELSPNGSVVDHFHEKILRGNDPVQNVFVIDARPNGILNKEIRFEIPDGSLAIVIFRTGNNAHIQYGLWGEEALANNTLYVFEDAENIHMEVAADIWGSILAPSATFHGHRTGGHVSGNAALGAFAVNSASGFEFHLYPFVGGVVCGISEEFVPPPISQPVPLPRPVPPPRPTPEESPILVEPCPECPPCPEPRPCPECAPCPEPMPCTECAPCPEPMPCPECPPCPEPMPCPECPPCPEPMPCPSCPQAETKIEYRPYPVLIKSSRTRVIYRKVTVREKAKECQIQPGVIFGCIWGCSCHCNHNYTVKLYKICDEKKTELYCEKVGPCSCFEFKVPYDGCYVLEVCPIYTGKKKESCKPTLTLKNVGVSSLAIID